MKKSTNETRQFPIRIVTATSLYDGHDAAINVMRRILQSKGAELIHLGHNRSVYEVVTCAIQEDANSIAISSYQGGHTEYLKHMYDLLCEHNCEHIKIFAGGGGVILPEEIKELHAYGICHIYTPDEGRSMGLHGMLNDLMQKSDFSVADKINFTTQDLHKNNIKCLSRAISAIENNKELIEKECKFIAQNKHINANIVLGITGTGGAGKSSLVDELVRRFLKDFEELHIAIISVDPSKRKTGGALLGDRIRMNSISNSRVYMRSMATRHAHAAVSEDLQDVISLMKVAGFDIIIVETSGIGQSGSEITDYSDVNLYAMTPEYGAATQLEKIDMLDYADLVALNKFDKHGAKDALHDVKKQYQRNQQLFEEKIDSMPVYGTIASQFNDTGMHELYLALLDKINTFGYSYSSKLAVESIKENQKYILPQKRVRYLSEIADSVRNYNVWVEEQSELASKLQSISTTKGLVEPRISEQLQEVYDQYDKLLDTTNREILTSWSAKKESYQTQEFAYRVRNKEIRTENYTETLSGLMLPKVILPTTAAWKDILKWSLLENVPGKFPFAAGVFPFKRQNEDPTRMFAGEGSPERTNKRFHYLSANSPAKRLSTAFDSVTLYGENPDTRPDIYGKIGNAGVSIASLDDAKKLYSGFDLANKFTSVSMTINGPAPMLMAFFLNVAVDQQCELYIKENQLENEVEEKIESIYKKKGGKRPTYHGALPDGNNGLGLMLLGVSGNEVLTKEVYNKIKSETLQIVRGTVQADILKEDQAQNTCIFSTDFSLQLMGDVQEYFIEQGIRNFYSVSISGYHIAEAGANPITQLAFTLANGFTYLEYYLARGMKIDDFAPNLSFFFSNGTDPEYAVLGRVARIIWSKAISRLYKGNERSQKLKYHIQTSGRSLHAQEMDFNDIRTTLQALYAIYDNCNSLHTNAYDEAITTPTESSVRRAMAIQLIINKELGLAKNENPLQGAFIIEELTKLVEEAVLNEFDRITERGGVLGAMETMYQRNKIQEESLVYESLKHSGELPVIGVNTFLSSAGSPTSIPDEVIRATKAEKENQIHNLEQLHTRCSQEADIYLERLKNVVTEDKNVFEELMETVKHCSIGQITNALFEVGGQYRRNM